MLEFVDPTLYPEKPNRITKEIGNMIFIALSGKVKIKWGQVIYNIVSKLVSVLGSRKTTPLGPYFYHLYGKASCLKAILSSRIGRRRRQKTYQLKRRKENLQAVLKVKKVTRKRREKKPQLLHRNNQQHGPVPISRRLHIPLSLPRNGNANRQPNRPRRMVVLPRRVERSKSS